MNLLKIISDIEKVDPEIYDRLDPRRSVFKHFGVAGKALASAAVPGLVASIFSKAYGQGTGSLDAGVAGVLNFALKLEYLEMYFYKKGLATTGLIPAGTGRDALTRILQDETAHVATLRATLGSQAIAVIPETAFDFTGSGNGSRPVLFGSVFTDYATFLTVAQAFEDTGVRAYKGGAAALITNKAVLTAALNIHSVEARHASRLRTMRRGGPAATVTTPKSWVANGDSIVIKGADIYGPGSPAAPVSPNTDANASKFFPAESNVKQGGVDLSTLPSLSTLGFSATTFAESFDEPLDVATVTTVAANFTVSGTL